MQCLIFIYRGYFIFFALLTILASLNDYWYTLKLDVVFAPDPPKDPADSSEDKNKPDKNIDSDNIEKVHEEGTTSNAI